MVLLSILLLVVVALGVAVTSSLAQQPMTSTPQLLTEPFLQLPTARSVRVVWFTEFEGDRHQVAYGQDLEFTATATTTQLSRTREDQQSRVGAQTETGQVYQHPVRRPIWRHEAEVTGLEASVRLPYRVLSRTAQGETVYSDVFTLAPLPADHQPLKILLTSDHQLMPMTPANLQKVEETIGQVDAVFLAGDLVNIPDRASEWFDDNRGGAFFPSLQGRANYELEREGGKTRYRGGALIQHAPLFPAVGNHEVMGQFSMEKGLGEQFNDAVPRQAAEQQYALKAKQINPERDLEIRDRWIYDHSFNIDTYREIFTLPEDGPDGSSYYAISFGNIRLVTLYATNIWRRPDVKPDVRGRYQERQEDLDHPERWGYGQHIFEAIAPGSAQYTWLQAELNSPEFQQAKYKIVMFHHPPHSLGDNIVPAYTNPVQMLERDPEGRIQAIRYEYPKSQDYLIRDVVPLLEQAGVQLVLFGHSHLWNRFVSPTGLHFLETSNVGNTYGAAWNDQKRPVPTGYAEDYTATGNPNGLAPIVPTLSESATDPPQPYLASNDITVFSIFETATGTISSYWFDTRQPDSEVVKFDEFRLRSR